MADRRRTTQAGAAAPTVVDADGPGSGAGGDRLDRHTIVVALVVVVGAVMAVLDTTIVNVALDTLGRDLHASLSTAQWVVTGYLLTLALVMPITGWAVDRFGAKRCWMLSIALFITGSALSGLAWSMTSLILFRLLQGLGGGMILPVGQTIVARVAGPQRMGRVMSVLGVPILLGPVAGPVLGGYLVQDISWHWIFYVNVPIGVVALILAARVLPSSPIAHEEKLDLPGLVLVSAAVTAIVYGLSQADTYGGFGDPHVYGWATAGALLLAAFAAYSVRLGRAARAAIIDVRLFRDRFFSAASATSFLMGFGLFGAMLLLPLYYQVVRGNGALDAGLLLVPQGIGAAAAMPLAGRLTDRIGVRQVVLPGIGLAVLGTFVFTRVGAQTSYVLLAGSLLVRGFGLGSTMMPSIAAAYATLTREVVPRATTAINIVRQIGGSLGTAVLAVMLARTIRDRLPASGASHGLGGVGSIPPALREHVAPLLASAFGQTFWVAFALTAAVALPAFFLPGAPVSQPTRARGSAAEL